MLQVYNTITRKKEEFKPITEGKVNFYACGPTVYDYFHIGNLRSFLSADMIRRYLEYSGYDVTFAMNLTDIDDKIIKRANEQGVDTNEIASKFSDAFFEDIDKFGMKKADIYPRATQHIGDIIAMIKRLEENGIAYNINGNVFYDISKFEGYGKLSGKNTDELEVGSRVEVNTEKNNPLDFSLWKKAKEGEPSWDSPWGKGRPGWHIECSAMSCKHLGETFDIHAGGSDLIFPHHENEIAQSEGANGKQFVRYWLHFGFLNIDNEKMSKSLGNFFTAREIAKKYHGRIIRFFFSQTHYGAQLNFTEEALDAAKKGLERIDNFVLALKEKLAAAGDAPAPEFSFEEYHKKFSTAMDDDFNTPKAIAVVFEYIKDVNKALNAGGASSKEFIEQALGWIEQTAQGVIGVADVNIEPESGGSSLEGELIELLIKLRQEAKQDKNYALADKIRDELKEIGVVLADSKEGTTYKKV